MFEVLRCAASILTISVLAKTIGKAKLLNRNPIVKKIDNSRHEFVPSDDCCIYRLAIIVGIGVNR